jgi:hypothetical protein
MVVIIKVELRSYRDQNLRCMSVHPVSSDARS